MPRLLDWRSAMTATIRLTVLTGPHRGHVYCIHESGTSTVGRSSECDVCLRGDVRDLCISRRHCRLTFDPPNVFVADLGSVNGTFVNGHPCADHVSEQAGTVNVSDGDILTVGGTSLQVNISECAHANAEEGITKDCPIKC